jgi:hypothetical protein
MRSTTFLAIAFFLLCLALSAWQFHDAAGCAAVPPPGRSVTIRGETAIIVWDQEQQLEHFIRSATFDSDADDFGFLVPTLSQPTLYEVDQGAFSLLAETTAPPVIYRPGPSAAPSAGGCSCSASHRVGAAPNAKSAPLVRVLEEARVAGHEATVLEADDPDSLASWLQEHGYPSSPQLSQWLEPYIAAQWKVTAFKYARTDDQPRLASAAIRLTFATEHPLYPYREPATAATPEGGPTPQGESRLLRVFYVGPARYQGELGEEAKPWLASTVWANRLHSQTFEKLSQMIQIDDSDAPWWLTEFEDHSSPRPNADDLYFDRSPRQETVAKQPVYAASAPASRGDAMAYIAAGGMVSLYVIASRRRTS